MHIMKGEDYIMKTIFHFCHEIVRSFAYGAACVVGMFAGMWLWNDVLEEKAKKLSNRLKSDKEES